MVLSHVNLKSDTLPASGTNFSDFRGIVDQDGTKLRLCTNKGVT